MLTVGLSAAVWRVCRQNRKNGTWRVYNPDSATVKDICLMVVILWGSAAVTLLAVGVASVLWIVFSPVAARRLAEMPWFPSRRGAITPDDYPEGIFDIEEVSFQTADGVQLAGSYLPATARQRIGVVIFCHELGGNRSTALAFTSGLRDQGFDILTFDFRNHGASGTKPGYKPVPWATDGEAADIRAALDYCCRRDGALAGRIALFGLSRGASAAFCVAAADPRVQAAVLDSIVPTERVQLYLVRRFMHLHLPLFPQLAKLPDCLLGLLVFWANRIIQRRHHCQILRIDRAARKTRKPVLLIHGTRDSFVPLETVCTLRKRMRRRPRLWVISQARHNETVHEAGEDYARRVARFLTVHMGVHADTVSEQPEPVPAGVVVTNTSHYDSPPVAW